MPFTSPSRGLRVVHGTLESGAEIVEYDGSATTKAVQLRRTEVTDKHKST